MPVVIARPPAPTVFSRPSFPPAVVFRVSHGSRRHGHVRRPPITPNTKAGFIFPLLTVSSYFHPHLASASRALLPPLHCYSCAMSRTAVQATGAVTHASPASPPRAVPWHRATGHQAVPARSHQIRADTVHPGRESTAPLTLHFRPLSSTPPHSTCTAVVNHSPPRCLQSVHLDAGVLRGHSPHYQAPPAHRILTTGRMAAAATCAHRRTRARASSREPIEGLGHQVGSAS
jgi:hypothetical protein